MRRLTDVTITSADRPAPPRRGAARGAISRGKTTHTAALPNDEPRSASRTRRRRATPPWRKRLRIGVAIVLSVTLLGGAPLWLARSGTASRVLRQATDRMIALSVRSGLRVETIEVEGRKHVTREDLLAALDIKRGDPILGLDLAAARARAAALPGVKSVTIQRRLPDELEVLVTEREPIAVWQSDGHYRLVDRDGVAGGENIDDFPGLPLVVGPGAAEHVAALLDMFEAEPALMARVKASQWVSGERWAIELTGPAGDIEVRLPEDDPTAAWHELARLESERKLLERKVTVIDMRLPDRLVLRVPGGIDPPAKAAPTPSTPSARHKAPGRDA